MHRDPDSMRSLAYERAGGGSADANYDPDLLATLTEAADEIERLRERLAEAHDLACRVTEAMRKDKADLSLYNDLRDFIDSTTDSADV